MEIKEVGSSEKNNTEIERTANKIIDNHELDIEKDEINYILNIRLKRTLGQVDYKAKRIEISKSLWKNGKEKEKRDVLLHELIHLETGTANHGRSFKRRCYEIGRPDLAKSTIDIKASQYKYKIKCQGCGAEFLRYRNCELVRNVDECYCGGCGGELKIVDEK